MKYAGKIYSGDILVGSICANSLPVLKRIASHKCNDYFRPVDTMVLHRADDKEIKELTFTRINKLAPDNGIVRGQWNLESFECKQ